MPFSIMRFCGDAHDLGDGRLITREAVATLAISSWIS